MIASTKAIVLKTVKFGESGLIVNLFSEHFGRSAYLLRGVRSASAKVKRANLLQPLSLLDVVAEHKPGRNLQVIKEFAPSRLYERVPEDPVRTAIAFYFAELLWKLLPPDEPLDACFDAAHTYACALDTAPAANLANFPIYFTISCGKLLGYQTFGTYTPETPYADAAEGGFSAQPPSHGNLLEPQDLSALQQILDDVAADKMPAALPMNAAARQRILDWYLAFLQLHTQHLGRLQTPAMLAEILR